MRGKQLKAEIEKPTGSFIDRMKATLFGGGTSKQAELLAERADLQARLALLNEQASDDAKLITLTRDHALKSAAHQTAHNRNVKF